jgi:polysaccharide deacetylase family protein (PEP-CTERM system associated)
VVERLLAMLAEHGARGTFFTVGWLAEREPAVVRAIAAAGHELASHSWEHVRITRQSPAEFRASVRRSKALLEDQTGAPVKGFRAPSWSIVPGTEWALDVLLEEGYVYDSSMFPVSQHPDYGYPGARRDPHAIARLSGTIVEVPPATLRLLGSNLPAAGGAYLRFFPLALIRGAIRQAEQRGHGATLYIHPWELDDYVPDLPMSAVVRFRTFAGRGRSWGCLRRLFAQFRFERIDRALERIDPEPIVLP